MDMTTIEAIFVQYGAIAIFITVLLEYMNMPGFPAGIIMPLAGILAKNGEIGFFATMIITVMAGLLGSLILYGVGRYGGSVFMKWYSKKFPKSVKKIEKNMVYIENKGMWGVFICKLMPMIRTIIGIPAGIIRMNLWKYTISSAAGVFIWNLVLVGAGYYFGAPILEYFI